MTKRGFKKALLPHLVDDHGFDRDMVYDSSVMENLERHRVEHEEFSDQLDHFHGPRGQNIEAHR